MDARDLWHKPQALAEFDREHDKMVEVKSHPTINLARQSGKL